MKNKLTDTIVILLVVLIGLLAAIYLMNTRDYRSVRLLKYTLKNNLDIILYQEKKATPLVSIQGWIRTDTTDGLSALLEKVLAQNPELLKEIEKRGGHFNSAVNYDYTFFSILIPSGETAFGLSALAEILFDANFQDKDLATARQELLNSLSRAATDPETRLQQYVHAKIYQDHPYGRNYLGDPAKIKKYTLPDLKAYYESFYVPNNITIVLSGNFDKDDAEKALRKLSIRPEKPIPASIIRNAISSNGQYYQSYIPNLGNPRYLIVYSVPGISSPDSYALTVLACLLGNSSNSLLNQKLNNPAGLAQNVSCIYQPAKDRSLFIVDFSLTNLNQLEKIRRQYPKLIKPLNFSKAELQEAQTRLGSDYYLRQASAENSAWDYGYSNTLDSYEYARDYLLHINNVSERDLQVVLEKYFSAGEQFLFN